jgi:hypothetical protein
MKIIVNKIIIVDRKTKQFIKEIKFGSGDWTTLPNKLILFLILFLKLKNLFWQIR